jgi:hypothetical protein
MTDLKINASAYHDPLFNALQQQIAGCNDHYPVLMLPVRLETRFRKVSRYVNVVDPDVTRFNNVFDKVLKIIHDLQLLNRTPELQSAASLKPLLERALDELSALPGLIAKIREMDTADRKILRDLAGDLMNELGSALISKYSTLKTLRDDLKDVCRAILQHVQAVSSPSVSRFQPGFDAMGELEKLDMAMAGIYGVNRIQASQIDATLGIIDAAMQQFTEVVEKPGFLAREVTIAAISSKISYIKRSQKNSPVRLTDFKKAYSGSIDLQSREYQLRNQINDLKTRIDDDYVPYMKLLATLKQYPVRQLGYMVKKCTATLKVANTAGFTTAGSLLGERKALYQQLRKIREHAHLPLEGSITEINKLKADYSKLEKELMQLMEWSEEVTPKTRAHRVGLARLRTHLRNEYIQDLKNLRTGEKETLSQVFSNEKVRHTATACQTTMKSLQAAYDTIKNTSMPAEKAMLLASARLEELERNIKISASNTILLPRDVFRQTLSTLQGLTDQMVNFYNRNKVSANHFLKTAVNSNLESIHSHLQDQLTDVFNQRDPFYDEFRKRITFLVNSETINELWVRIYPDDIAIDNHDERLTNEELQVGKDYYNAVYSLPDSEREEAMLPAWRAAATAIGARRAAYVIKLLRPEEVKQNNVPDPLNPIPPLKDALLSIFSTIHFAGSFLQREQNSRFIKDLPGTLQNTLAPASLTPCSRTREDLDSLNQIIRDAVSGYELMLKEAGGSFTDIRLEQEYQALKFSQEIILDYYKTNLHALQLPFDPQLSFPEPEMRSKAWDRAGITSVMPDRFVVVTKRGEEVRQIVVGKPISPTLEVGIDPDTPEEDGFYHLPNGELHIPEKLRWMFDFDAAVEAGMGIKVPIKGEDFEKGFSFVMAYGVKTHEDLPSGQKPGAGQQLLNQLIENHLYSDGGFEYLPVGTATNNTDAVKSPYTTLDDDYDGLFELFVKQQPAHGNLPYTADNEMLISDGQFFRDALGLPNHLAECIRNHQKEDIAESRAMSRLLFGATLGYYMRFMLRNLFTGNDMNQVIPFMMRHVSAVGNLPAFRIDKQPYGIMPITLHHKLWVNEPNQKGTYGSFIHKLSMFLAATRKVYEQEMVKKVNTINSPAYEADPQKVFLEILGLNPCSKQYLYREGANVGERWGDLRDLPDAELLEWSEEHAVNPSEVSKHYEYLLNRLGHSTAELRMRAMLKTRCYGARYVNSNDVLGHPVQYPEQGRGKLLEWEQESFQGNYIEWLSYHSSNPEKLCVNRGDIVEKKWNTLLFELLRISLLYDNSDFAIRAATKIAHLEVPVLERLMAGHLDLCSYRIDAWQTGLADYCLRELRKTKPVGLFIGAYGFVENLNPAPAAKEQLQHFPEGLEPDDDSVVEIMPDNQGFIHGPTLNHAVTAAVLRAGFNSRKKDETSTNNVFGINLSSSRIRKALHMLEGVARGQETGALLGYQFERALHEKYKDNEGQHLEMDAIIYLLRRRFPTYSDKLFNQVEAGVPEEGLKAVNVLDGLELLDYMEDFIINHGGELQWSDDKSFVEMLMVQQGGTTGFPDYPYGLADILPSIDAAAEGNAVAALNRQKARAIIRELDNMADSLDAMGDLITAEGVYQLVRGNHTRASAILSAMSEGRIPTDPEIIRNMREGTMVSHRVMLAMEHGGEPTAWSVIPDSPRSLAEPALNRWLATQLGDPATVAWRAVFGNTTTYFTLADLGMQPIDLVILAGSGEEGLSGLEKRAAHLARQHGAGETDTIAIDFYQAPPEALSSLGEQLALIQQLGKIAVKSRVADGRDFRLPEADESFGLLAPSINTEELYDRLRDAVQGYSGMLQKLSVFLPGVPVTPTLLATAAERSIELTNWGFQGYYPDISGEQEETDLIQKILSAKETMTHHLQRAEDLLASLPLEPEQVKWIEASREIGELLFGSGFKIIPRLSIAEAPELKARMQEPHASGILRNINAEEMETWFSDLAMVRKNLAPLDTFRMLTDVCRGQKIPFSVVQLPHIPNATGTTDEYWLGASFPETWQPEEDKLSLAVFGYEDLAGSTCAIIFDEWTEIIPVETQTSGIALHYNQPDARPPQSLMLAVSPVVTGAWSIDDLGLIVEEAYKMARIRAVEPDHFDKTLLAQLLPAISLLSGGDAQVVSQMLSVYKSFDEEIKSVFVNFGDVNEGTGEERTEII